MKRNALLLLLLASGCSGYTEEQKKHVGSFHVGDVVYLKCDKTRKLVVASEANPSSEIRVRFFSERGELEFDVVEALCVEHEAQ